MSASYLHRLLLIRVLFHILKLSNRCRWTRLYKTHNFGYFSSSEHLRKMTERGYMGTALRYVQCENYEKKKINKI